MKRYVMTDKNGTVVSAGIAQTIPNGALELPAGIMLDKIVGGTALNGQFVELSGFGIAQATAQRAIADFAESARQKIAGNPTVLKASAWSSKEARARRIIAGTATSDDTALVQSEATQRGKNETVLQLAEKQLAKAQLLLHAVSVIDGMESRAVTAVQAAADSAGIDAVMAAMKAEADAALEALTS